MSLTSRLFSLITSDSSSNAQLRQSHVANEQDGFTGTLLEPGSIRQNTGLRTMDSTIEDDLEAKRPPYWHVSQSTAYTTFRANTWTEHARRWYRRHQWRYRHAFARHSQNKTARRSSFPTQIHEPAQFIRYHLQARGPPERAIRRLWSGNAGVFPRDRSVFRILRVLQKEPARLWSQSVPGVSGQW